MAAAAVVPLLILLTVAVATRPFSPDDAFTYSKVLPELASEAQLKGRAAFLEYSRELKNSTDYDRQFLYDSYITVCNTLGTERERIVARAVQMNKEPTYKLLLTTGMSPFVARFLTLNSTDLEINLQHLCTKYELQLQCQVGFGESRKRIEQRIEKMKRENGNLRVLLEEECMESKFNSRPYHCLRTTPEVWTAPCAEQMLNYNYTRYSTGRRIAKLHFDTTNKAAAVAEFNETSTREQLDKIKHKIESIMREGLRKIAEVEAEKCAALKEVVACTLPAIAAKCGNYTRNVVETMILEGYLPRERREVLQSQFEQYGVPTHKNCTALHSSI